ncbi:MAG TPA: riboflavin synthase [Actinomycetota bacterium]|jgi:riboflavin synthase
MFTGIVVEQGRVSKAKNARGLLELEIESPHVARGLEKGDSVAVNGVCLTATSTGRRKFEVEAMSETLQKSTLASLKRGATVNLELAARLHDRIGGHLVQGHVDGVARVLRMEDDGGARRVWLEAPDNLVRYLVPKGSVTLDGVSLTVVEAGKSSFEVALIPHTLGVTTLSDLSIGSEMNLEVDVIAKYVERLGAAWSRNGGRAW